MSVGGAQDGRSVTGQVTGDQADASPAEPGHEPDHSQISTSADGRCAVGVVLYNPDLAVLCGLLEAVSPEVEEVWLFLNSVLPEGAEARLRAACRSGLRLLNDGSNPGLGIAYNRMAEAARAAGADQLLIFDQDSSPPPGMLRQLRATHAALRAAGERPAIVGPLAVSADDGVGFKPPRTFPSAATRAHGTAWPAEFVISSGSLLDLGACAAVGGFREDFFIDAVDIEWCFRAWAVGWSCWIESAVRMPHRLGQGTIRLPVLNMRLTRQPPSRLYTYVRNQVAMLGLPHTPRRWKLRLLPHMAVQAAVYFAASPGRRGIVLRAFRQGLSDGLRGRLGAGRRGGF